MTYKTRLRTWDFLPLDKLHVGSRRHTWTMDLLGSIATEEEEDLVRLLLHGWKQQDIAAEFGVHQTTISRRVSRLRKMLGHD